MPGTELMSACPGPLPDGRGSVSHIRWTNPRRDRQGTGRNRSIRLLLAIASCAFAQTDPLTSGLEAFARGDYPTAERQLRLASTNPQAKAFLAMTLAATNRCDEALADLKLALDSATPSTTQRLAGLALAQCHLSASRFDDATPVLAQLKRAFPTDADVLYLSARLHMRAWNESLRDLYRSAPGSYRVNQISGEILETQGEFTAAAAEYRKAIEKNPEALSLHFRLGRALLMSTHSPDTYEAARKEFEAELTRNPRDAVAHYQIAQILLAQDKSAEAGARLERALTIDPDFAEALIALGKLRAAEKRNDDAIRLLSRAAELQPRNETAHYNLMLAYRNAGRLEDARREKSILDTIQKPPEGEFSDFLKKLGEKPTPPK
jgi:tetratricopeptide (TPR) repeat protein